jgi:hypothetical protein
MTLRKKLTEYPTATPSLIDYAAGKQAEKVKLFKYQDIYNLFKSNYDSVYATISSVTNALANYVTTSTLATTLTNYVTNSSLVSTLNSYVLTSVYTIGLAGKQDIYVANEATAASTVTINAKTGTAIFTAPILTNTVGQFTINNTFVGPTKRVLWSLNYDFAGGATGIPQIVCHNTTGSGITFYIKNIGVNNTNSNLNITFIILN